MMYYFEQNPLIVEHKDKHHWPLGLVERGVLGFGNAVRHNPILNLQSYSMR